MAPDDEFVRAAGRRREGQAFLSIGGLAGLSHSTLRRLVKEKEVQRVLACRVEIVGFKENVSTLDNS